MHSTLSCSPYTLFGKITVNLFVTDLFGFWIEWGQKKYVEGDYSLLSSTFYKSF